MNFSWQHDARWHENNILTLFDNSASSNENLTAQSRAMAIELDIPTRQVKLRGAYYHPQEMKALSQGNVQVLKNTGNIFVGLGHSAAFIEFHSDGTLLCDVHFGASAFFTFGRVLSYRVFKGSWIGKPLEGPSAEVLHGNVFVSWNGATEVCFWRLEVGEGQSFEQMAFQPLTQFEKRGFETQIPIPEDVINPYFRLDALGSKNEVLGYTGILEKNSSSRRNKDFFSIIYWAFTAFAILGIGFRFKRVLRRRLTWRRFDLKTHC